MSFEFVPISENLRREELVLQITDRLRLIQTFSETLFGRVDKNVENIRNKLANINTRSEICLRKINHLKEDDKRATTFYSHPRFPSKEIGTSHLHESLFVGETFSLDNSIKIKMKDKNLIDGKGDLQRHSIMSTHIPYDDDSKLKSQFFIYDKSLNVSFVIFKMEILTKLYYL